MNETCALCPELAEFEYAGQNLCSACVSREAAKVEKPDEPKAKHHRNKGKSISEIEAKANYSGEASPYWDDVAQQHWQKENTRELFESPEANPDVLPESASLYAHTPGDDEELRAEILRDVIEQLTPLQREALALCEEVGYTEERAAKKLEMTRRAFRTIISRVKKILETKYEQRQKNSPWQK